MYCSFCGKEIQQEAVFCRHCGKKVQTPAVDNTAKFSVVGKLFRKNALFLIIALIDLIWFFYYRYYILQYALSYDTVAVNILAGVNSFVSALKLGTYLYLAVKRNPKLLLWAVLLHVVQTGGYDLFFDGRSYYLSNIINFVIELVFTGILLLATRAVKKIRSEKCTSLLAAGVALVWQISYTVLGYWIYSLILNVTYFFPTFALLIETLGICLTVLLLHIVCKGK